MKGLLVLQRRFAYIGHELAILLRDKHGVSEFCAYVHLRDSYDFLLQQKDIPYTGLVLDEAIQKEYKKEPLDLAYLEEFEREYGSVWDFISVDRVIRYGQLAREYPFDTSPYSYDELLRIVQVYAKKLVAFIEKEKPDFIFTYQPGALGSLMLYRIAKKKGIPVITIIFPVTKNRITVSEVFERLSGVEEAVQKSNTLPLKEIPKYAEAKNFIDEFRQRPVIYSSVYNTLVRHGRRKQFAFLSPKKIWFTTYYNAYAVLKQWRANKERQTDYTSRHPTHYFLDRIKRKTRTLVGADDLYDSFDKDLPYVFYPLHVEPEMAVLLLAPFDTDQIAIIKRVARSLPAGMYVYVKEHPQMFPYRPRRFYKELKKIPNVKLLRPELSSFDIIKQSKMVAIISGAAGWEASLLGKPVITFGEVFYNALPSVAHSDTPRELPELVRAQLSATFDEEALTRYVAALFEDSAECDLLELWEKTDDLAKKREGLQDFARVIARYIDRLVS
jgi:hypothetical protein